MSHLFFNFWIERLNFACGAVRGPSYAAMLLSRNVLKLEQHPTGRWVDILCLTAICGRWPTHVHQASQTHTAGFAHPLLWLM